MLNLQSPPSTPKLCFNFSSCELLQHLGLYSTLDSFECILIKHDYHTHCHFLISPFVTYLTNKVSLPQFLDALCFCTWYHIHPLTPCPVANVCNVLLQVSNCGPLSPPTTTHRQSHCKDVFPVAGNFIHHLDELCLLMSISGNTECTQE